jgi:hypothetical protein
MSFILLIHLHRGGVKNCNLDPGHVRVVGGGLGVRHLRTRVPAACDAKIGWPGVCPASTNPLHCGHSTITCSRRRRCVRVLFGCQTTVRFAAARTEAGAGHTQRTRPTRIHPGVSRADGSTEFGLQTRSKTTNPVSQLRKVSIQFISSELHYNVCGHGLCLLAFCRPAGRQPLSVTRQRVFTP